MNRWLRTRFHQAWLLFSLILDLNRDLVRWVQNIQRALQSTNLEDTFLFVIWNRIRESGEWPMSFEHSWLICRHYRFFRFNDWLSRMKCMTIQAFQNQSVYIPKTHWLPFLSRLTYQKFHFCCPRGLLARENFVRTC